MLQTAGDRLSPKRLRRLTTVLATDEIGAAWGCKELLRHLLDAPADREEIRTRLWRFYIACAAADIPRPDNFQRRILTHIAVTRPCEPHEQAAPLKVEEPATPLAWRFAGSPSWSGKGLPARLAPSL
jgi:hypothetical protein